MLFITPAHLSGVFLSSYVYFTKVISRVASQMICNTKHIPTCLRRLHVRSLSAGNNNNSVYYVESGSTYKLIYGDNYLIDIYFVRKGTF